MRTQVSLALGIGWAKAPENWHQAPEADPFPS